jgi:hypothetical protein
MSIIPALASADASLAVGHGFRADSWHAAAGVTPLQFERGRIGGELAFYSMGEQPDGFENINRMAEINLIGFSDFTDRVTGFAKVGANNTRWSHNGTNDYDRSGDSLWGWQAGVGLETAIAGDLSAYMQVTTYEYRQVNNPNKGGYTYSGFGLRYRFP